jgi:hypothetical protein
LGELIGCTTHSAEKFKAGQEHRDHMYASAHSCTPWAVPTLVWLLPAPLRGYYPTPGARWGQPNSRGVATRVGCLAPVAPDTPNPPYTPLHTPHSAVWLQSTHASRSSRVPLLFCHSSPACCRLLFPSAPPPPSLPFPSPPKHTHKTTRLCASRAPPRCTVSLRVRCMHSRRTRAAGTHPSQQTTGERGLCDR